jgi:glycosyltransferase involved in cell wall biosynthesis
MDGRARKLIESASPRFSLVIPCYNESRGLEELIRKCRFVAAEGRGEVILVDNGSTDKSFTILTEHLGKPANPADVWWVHIHKNEGYGHGIVRGLQATRSGFVGWTHADMQTDPADVLRATERADTLGPSALLVKGRRYGRGVGDRFFTAGMSIFESILMGRVLTDINAQPTMFSRELLSGWGTPPSDFALDVFTLFTARQRGYRIARIPVIFASRKWGSSHWNTGFRARWKFIKRTIAFSVELKRRK